MEPTSTPPKPAHDPTKVSRSLAIALVVSGVFLLAAVGIATWLLLRGGGPVASTIQDPDAATKNVKNVSIVVPDSLPAEYAKNDQSPLGVTRTYYYDNAANCGFTVIVSPLVTDKNAKDTAMGIVESSQAQGATVTAVQSADQVNLKDTNDDTSYAFDSLDITQSVNVPGVPYTSYKGVVLYKQFGQKVAALAYGCQDSEWAARKDGLAEIARAFTVTTER